MMKARLLESSPGLYSKSHRLGYISTGQNKNILMDYIPPNWYLKKNSWSWWMSNKTLRYHHLYYTALSYTVFRISSSSRSRSCNTDHLIELIHLSLEAYQDSFCDIQELVPIVPNVSRFFKINSVIIFIVIFQKMTLVWFVFTRHK